MAHALIIGDNMIISRAIENCLISLGFNSFDRTLTEAQALAVAECRPPDLVVIDETVACGSASIVAEHMVEQFETPIILMTAGQCEVRRRLPQGAILNGPFLLSDMGNAVAAARCSGAVSVPTTKPGLLAVPHTA